MDFSEKWGDSVDSAVAMALAELNTTPDQVDIEVLEQPSRGFFGIGAKLALVRVTKKAEKKAEAVAEAAVEEKPAVKKSAEEINAKFDRAAEEAQKRRASEPQEQTAEKRDSDRGSRDSRRNNRGERRSSGRSDRRGEDRGGRNDRKNNNRRNDRRNRPEKRDYDKIIGESEPIMPSIDKASLTDMPQDHAAVVFLEGVVKEMGLDIAVKGKTDGKDLFLELEGKDTGTVIGKRGATLDAIQYLTSLVVNKDDGEYIRVVVDAEEYRAKREKSLEKLAMRLADKVVRSRRSFKLESMNPYERKVIHATLQKDDRVVTRSEGQDPYRRVIIELK